MNELTNLTDNIEYLSADDAATLTGRNPQVIRRWMREPKDNPRLPSVGDPTDRRRKLVRSTDLEPLLGAQRPRQVGYELRSVTFTRGDGSTFTRKLRLERR